jgi:hypothetical protein
MKRIISICLMLFALKAQCYYRCEVVDGDMQLLNQHNKIIKSWGKSQGIKKCVQYMNKNTFNEYRCDVMPDNDTAVLYNAKNDILHKWDREFGAEKDLSSCLSQLSFSYVVGAFRCVKSENGSKDVYLKNTENKILKVFTGTENNLNSCRDHIRPSSL